MNDEIIKGEDRLGVLVMGHDFNSWWTGSLLDI
jgi:homospermidine synthase